MLYNKLIYSNDASDRSRLAILDSYVDVGRLALIRSTMLLLTILDKEGAVRSFMTEREKELAYDARILNPFKDCFYIKKYTFAEANQEIQNQMNKLGDTVISIYLSRAKFS